MNQRDSANAEARARRGQAGPPPISPNTQPAAPAPPTEPAPPDALLDALEARIAGQPVPAIPGSPAPPLGAPPSQEEPGQPTAQTPTGQEPPDAAGPVPPWLQERPPEPAPPASRFSRQRIMFVALLGLLAVAILGLATVVLALRAPQAPAIGTPGLGGAATGAPADGAGRAGVDSSPTPDLAFFPAGGGATAVASPVVDTPDAPDPPLPPVLAPAFQAEQEGRYDDALAGYRPLATANPPQAASREARWRMAVTLFEAGHYDAAIESFAIFAHAYPADPRSLRAALWAGRAHLAAGRPAAALAEFTSYAPVAGPLRASTLLLAADAAAQQGDRDQERSLLNAALAEPVTHLDRLGAWQRLAALETAAGAPDKAAAWYKSIAQEAHDPAYQASSLLNAGKALLDAGQQEAGENLLINLVKTLPDQPAAYQGLQALLGSDPAALDSGRVGYDLACRVAFAAGQYDAAVNYCESFRAAQAPGPERADAAWYTARAYEAAGNTDLAVSWYKGFTEVYTADLRLPDALLRWGNLLAGEGDSAGALAQYARLAAYPDTPARAAAEDQAALLSRRLGDLAAAGEHWRLAALAPGADDDLRSRALFWRGWVLQQQGQAPQAAATWRQGATYHTFWGQRCADHLASATLVPRDTAANMAAGQARLQAALTPTPQSREDADRALLAWAAKWSAPGADVPPPDAVPARLAADSAYRRALALARAGVWDMANLAFSDLGTVLEGQRDGTALAALAIQARDAGWPWLAYTLSHNLRTAATAAGQPPGVTGLPRAAQEMVYPLAWAPLVSAEAQEQGVDPLLLLAMIRQESAYDPNAHSSADARGLTQVVPGTASGIASALHVPNFAQSLLYRPAISVRFGAFYLNDMLNQFDRNILYALAGYNGGPANVPNWAGGRVAGDPDLFIDNIDYAETRAYVQMVYANYGVYRWLYSQP